MRFHYLLLPVLGCLGGCEMPFEDNFFVDIPYEESAAIGIDLNLKNDGERLIINAPTTLCYALSGFGKEIVEARFRMGNKEWVTQQKNGTIYLSETNFPAGSYQLTCELYLKSNSGSLADQMNAEYYAGKLSWPVVIDYSLQVPGMIGYSSTNERFLKLHWQEPQFAFLKLKGYELTYTKAWDSRQITVGPAQLYWVDSLYVGEGAEYTLNAILEDPDNGESLYWQLGSLPLAQEIQTKSSVLTDGTVRFSWVTPYQSQFSIVDEATSSQYFPLPGADYIDFEPNPIQSKYWTDALRINFRVSPYNDKRNYRYSQTDEVLRYAAHLGNYWSYYACSQHYVYILFSNKLQTYRLPDYVLTAQTELESGYTGQLAESADGSIVAVRVDNVGSTRDTYIKLYKDASLKNPIQIIATDMVYNGFSNQQLMYLTTDQKLVYFTSMGGPITGVVVNATTGKREKTFSIANEYNFFYPCLSADGSRLCFTDSRNALVLIELDDYVETQRKTLYDNFYKYTHFFNPKQADELICGSGTQVEVWNLRTLEVVRAFELPRYASLSGIDRGTGNLLITGPNQLYIISSEDGRILMETKNNETSVQLTNNYLMSGRGYVMNVEKHLLQGDK